MSRYIDVRGKSTFGIGLCGRCSRKFSLEDLSPDPNSPGLMVCKDDLDEYDPYRLAPRGEDKITLNAPRPDVPLGTRPAGVIQEAGDEFIITESGDGFMEMQP
jgi:hypothetical protein